MSPRDGRRLAEAVSSAGWSVAVAESLTGGSLSSALARLPDAGEWYRGAVVADAGAVKYAVLGPGGPGSRDGIPAGTVWMAIHDPDRTGARAYAFTGDPADVVRQTCAAAVAWLADTVTSFRVPTSSGTGRDHDEDIV